MSAAIKKPDVSQYLLSAPVSWQGMIKRHSDPLGFQEIAQVIANAFVPGLSTRHWDVRWLTLLCKAISVLPNNFNEDIYTLISKFERGVLDASPKGTRRHLPGKTLAPKHCHWPHHYRYYAPWGCYKSLLVTCGLMEDNYHLTTEGEELANILIEKQLTLDGRVGIIAKLDNWEEKWLPLEPSDGRLEYNERRILKPLLFGNNDDGKVRRKTLENFNNEEIFWRCQSIGDDARWFDRFTKSCLTVLRKALDTCNPGERYNPSMVYVPEDIKEISARAVPRWEQVKFLADTISKCEEKTQIVESILRWHIKVTRAKQSFIETSEGFLRVAEKGVSVRAAYGYRLHNLWRIGRQLVPDLTSVIFPAWAENTDHTEDSDHV